MAENSLFKVFRGILVAIISSMIIGFMVIILGPLVPFIPFDGLFPLIILIVIFILTFITYFFLPSEVKGNDEVITPTTPSNLE